MHNPNPNKLTVQCCICICTIVFVGQGIGPCWRKPTSEPFWHSLSIEYIIHHQTSLYKLAVVHYFVAQNVFFPNMSEPLSTSALLISLTPPILIFHPSPSRYNSERKSYPPHSPLTQPCLPIPPYQLRVQCRKSCHPSKSSTKAWITAPPNHPSNPF